MKLKQILQPYIKLHFLYSNRNFNNYTIIAKEVDLVEKECYLMLNEMEKLIIKYKTSKLLIVIIDFVDYMFVSGLGVFMHQMYTELRIKCKKHAKVLNQYFKLGY